ncbi:MAG: cobaltochelatase subunit CobN [Bacteroidales bacterium]
MKVSRTWIYRLAIGLPICLFLWVAYAHFVAPTRIVTVNFPDFTVEKFIRSNNNAFVTIESIPMDRLHRLKKADMVLIRVHGNAFDKNHLAEIKKAIDAGIPVFATDVEDMGINSLDSVHLRRVSDWIENGSIKNYRSLFDYVRSEIDGKILFLKEWYEPQILPSDYFFHLGDDLFFADYASFQAYYEQAGLYKEGAPRVVLLSGNINLQNSNDEHITAIIQSLERKDINVYPIQSFGSKRLQMIESVQPNLIINRPHGRLLMGDADRGTRLLKKLNVPMMVPVTVSEEYSQWLNDKQGMTSGGMTTMSIVLPELDGGIAAQSIAAQFERNGRLIFDAIPRQTERFCRLVQKQLTLQTLPNKDKRVAIYYYKGMGKGAVNAADLEGVQSLYNTLLLLKDAGYTVDGLPSSAKELEKRIQLQGSVLGPYALGAYDDYLQKGNPEWIAVDTFKKWASEAMSDSLLRAMYNQYGIPPGDYMAFELNGKPGIAVARLQFGNVVLLPQPLPAVGEDVERIIHGVEGAPSYPYVASYLWMRYGFDADVLMHFGTHGNLEFIPGKQVALSEYDWTDVLVGDLPHVYLYTINNIGEGIIAKRRSYAALVSHLTAPFMQAELYDDFKKIKRHISTLESLEESDLKRAHRSSLSELCKKQNIHSALGLDTLSELTDRDVERIHQYIEELDGAKVTDGLYTLGEMYTSEQLRNTVRLMSVDPIRYALARLDVSKGLINSKQMDDLSFVVNHYQSKTERIIDQALSKVPASSILSWVLTQSDAASLNDILQNKAASAASAAGHPASMKTMMERMVQAESDALSVDVSHDALLSLKEAVERIAQTYLALKSSTEMEQKALLNALNGGYVSPSSAGDPIVNPKALPTGRNFYSINPESTPSPEAWRVGARLADVLLEQELSRTGHYPVKVSFTLWSSDFISSEGATIAQILHLLGVEPLRDGFGYIRSLQLKSAEELGRPRVDVVVQTSGQLRDIAASRLALIQQAVEMAAMANDSINYVRKGVEDAERSLLKKGFSPLDARRYAKERVFGGAGGNYGTGIMSLVESGDRWDSTSQIADRYIQNMGALYSANGNEAWGEWKEGVFEAALLNTSVVVQPRSSNTWGPLSLDHVYEFMGGLSAAVQRVTGKDPNAYFNDFRNSQRANVQELKEAIGVESNSTVFNPKFIAHRLSGESSSLNYFAETVRNTYGWNAMKPSAIDEHIWNRFYDVFVSDVYDLGMVEAFSDKNPYALQELTAVMLETVRKGMWNASVDQLNELVQLHTKMVGQFEAGCSGFICDNRALQEFIMEHSTSESGKTYRASIDRARNVAMSSEEVEDGVVLKKEASSKQASGLLETPKNNPSEALWWVAFGLVVLLFVVWIIRKRFLKK